MLYPLAFGATQTPPRIAVIDDFGAKRMDIDGDNVPDLSHGELVTRLLLSQCPQARITRLDVNPPDTQPLPPENSTVLFRQHYQNIFSTVNMLQPGQFDSINLSMGVQTPLPSDQISLPEAKRILRDFWISSNSSLQLLAARTAQTLAGLAKQGERIFLAAGNGGRGTANVYGLIPGVINVGATSANPQVLTDYTHRHSLVTDYTQGTFAVAKVRGGYDLTGDAKPEILDKEVSGGTPFVSRFVGKPLAEVLASEKELRAIHAQHRAGIRREKMTELQHRLVPLNELHRIGLLDNDALVFYRTLGDYAALNPRPYMATGAWNVFKTDKNGRINYDPDGSRRKGAVQVIEGASFSAPLLHGRYWQQRMTSQTGLNPRFGRRQNMD